jgi:hypothetical protein
MTRSHTNVQHVYMRTHIHTQVATHTYTVHTRTHAITYINTNMQHFCLTKKYFMCSTTFETILTLPDAQGVVSERNSTPGNLLIHSAEGVGVGESEI